MCKRVKNTQGLIDVRELNMDRADNLFAWPEKLQSTGFAYIGRFSSR